MLTTAQAPAYKQLLTTLMMIGCQEEQVALMDGIIRSMTEDLEKIREDAQSVHRCLTEHKHSAGINTHRHTQSYS